jgi:hypothetical protein
VLVTAGRRHRSTTGVGHHHHSYMVTMLGATLCWCNHMEVWNKESAGTAASLDGLRTSSTLCRLRIPW